VQSSSLKHTNLHSVNSNVVYNTRPRKCLIIRNWSLMFFGAVSAPKTPYSYRFGLKVLKMELTTSPTLLRGVDSLTFGNQFHHSFTGHFLGQSVSAGTRMSPLWILLELRVMEVVTGDNWSCKTCKAPVKSSPSTNQHPVFYRPDVLPVAQPTVSEQ